VGGKFVEGWIRGSVVWRVQVGAVQKTALINPKLCEKPSARRDQGTTRLGAWGGANSRESTWDLQQVLSEKKVMSEAESNSAKTS